MQSLDILNKLECPIPAIEAKFLHRYSQVSSNGVKRTSFHLVLESFGISLLG